MGDGRDTGTLRGQGWEGICEVRMGGGSHLLSISASTFSIEMQTSAMSQFYFLLVGYLAAAPLSILCR